MARHRRQLSTAAFALCSCVAAVATAQDLPQEAQWAIESSLQRLESSRAMATRVELEKSLDPKKLESFLDGAVVRLRFLPDGTFEALTLDGGELLAFELGKERVEPSGEASKDGRWLRRSGQYPLLKRPQLLSLIVRAGDREVSVDCYNKLKRSERAVTYHVGPLNGLFCMGLVDDGS